MKSGKESRVLLIENEVGLRDLNDTILREAGCRVENLPPYSDPADFAAQTLPDVIVVRILPNAPQDWQILDALTANPKTEAIPVVVISSTERNAVEAKAAPNVNQVVIMPYNVDALEQAVANALHHPPPAALLPPSPQPPPKPFAAAGKLLNGNSRSIVLRAIRCLQQMDPFKLHFAELTPGLLDDLPVIYGAIVIGLQRGLTPDHVMHEEAIRNTIREHANLRVSQGLDPGAVLREYQVLNDQMLAFLEVHSGEIPLSASEALDVARAIDGFIAESLRIAIGDFLIQTEKSTS